MDEIGQRPGVAGPSPDDGDRLEALERQVRQLMGRLAGWVESQLVQAVEDRRRDLRTLRAELQAGLDEQVAGARAEAASMLTVATRRLGVNHDELGERLQGVTRQAEQASERAVALGASAEAEAARTEAFEERVRSAMGRLTESVETRLAESAACRSADLDVVRSELHAAIDERMEQSRAANASMLAPVAERLEAVAGEASRTAGDVAALTASSAAEAARSEVFEERVRAAMFRLTESVDARLAEAASSRQADGDAMRREVLASMEARMPTLEAFRAELQSALDERLREIASQAATAKEGVVALAASAEAESARTEAFEERVRAAIVRLTESVDVRLAEAATGREADVEGLRGEWRAAIDAGRDTVLEAFQAQLRPALDERLRAISASVEAQEARSEALEERVRSVVSRLTDSVEALALASGSRPQELEAFRAELQAALDSRLEAASRQTTDGLASLIASLEAETARTEAFEHRVRSAMGRLAESVDTQLARAADERQADLDALRSGLQVTLAAQLGDKVGEHVDGRLAEVVELRRSEFDSLRAELQGALAQQLSEARSQIAAAVAGANRRFVRANEQLSERVEAVSRRTAGSAEKVDRLAEIVEARMAAMTATMPGDPGAEVAALRTDLESQVRAQMTTSAAEAAEAERRLLASHGRVEKRVTELAGQVAAAAARFDVVGASLEADEDRLGGLEERARQTEERLAQAVEARLAESVERSAAEVGALSAELARARSELDTTAALSRKSSRAQDQLRRALANVAARVDGLGSAMTAAASAETGALAPLRSDVRLLQTQVSELAERLDEARSAGAKGAPRKAAGTKATTTKPAPGAKRSTRATKNGQ